MVGIVDDDSVILLPYSSKGQVCDRDGSAGQ